MVTTAAKPMSVEAFLAWEEHQELRHEFDGFQPIAMTGGTYAHAQIQARLLHALVARLAGKPCRAVGSELKIRTSQSIRYPDAVVICSPMPLNATVAHDPVVIFEILSQSTANDDLGGKKVEYQALDTLKCYVVLQQTHRSAQVFRRVDTVLVEDGTSGEWTYELVAEPDAVIALPEIDIALDLAEIYDGILPEPSP